MNAPRNPIAQRVGGIAEWWREVGRAARTDAIFGGPDSNELDFLPAALEIVETPPAPAARLLSLGLVAFLLLAILWAFIGRLDVVATAPGKVVSNGGGKAIASLDPARVSAILVQDGQSVPAGAVLVRLEPTEARADRDQLAGELGVERLEVARLRVLALGEPFVVPPGADPAAADIARRRAVADVAERDAKLAALDRAVGQRDAELQVAHADLDRLNELSPVAAKRLDLFETLARKGFASKLQIIDSEAQARDVDGSIVSQRRKVPGAAAALAAARSERVEAAADARQKALADLADATGKADALADQLSKAGARLAGMTLTAPVAGTVQELAVHTIGGVVQPGQVVLRLSPAGHGVEIEAQLENKDVGFVRAGMAAEVKLDAFPFTRYGTVPARVLSVSADATTPQAAPGGVAQAPPVPTYAARLRLLRPTVMVDGQPRLITPGMAVVAEVKTGRRRIIDYILSPIARTFDEAGREP